MQYFHPDNMSSAEKLKIELAKVRDEFKMSDSDCGSARVQGKGVYILVSLCFSILRDCMFLIFWCMCINFIFRCTCVVYFTKMYAELFLPLHLILFVDISGLTNIYIFYK